MLPNVRPEILNKSNIPNQNTQTRRLISMRGWRLLWEETRPMPIKVPEQLEEGDGRRIKCFRALSPSGTFVCYLVKGSRARPSPIKTRRHFKKKGLQKGKKSSNNTIKWSCHHFLKPDHKTFEIGIRLILNLQCKNCIFSMDEIEI